MCFRSCLAELIATFALVFVGAGSILANGFSVGGLGLIGIALAHGLILAAMIYATGHISGAHINPAVTVAMLAARKIKLKEAIGYIVFQLTGAAIAGYLLSVIFVSPAINLHLGSPVLASGVSLTNGILIESVFTFFLVFVIFGTAVDKKSSQGFHGLAIGMTLTLSILVVGPLTGAALNPARYFGPSLASGFWENNAVYWIGPIIGAVLAGLVYTRIFLKEEINQFIQK